MMSLKALFNKNSFNIRRRAQHRPRFNLFRNERGAVTVMFLLSSGLVLGASFGAMDLVRYNVVQGRLQYALDGATLSAGRNLANLTPKPGTVEADQWKSDAFQYFRTNLPDGYMGSSILPEDLKINYSEEMSGAGNYVTGQFIDMDAKGILPLLSTGFFHIASFDVQASNRAVRRTRTDLEVVMALDNTGSMADEGKLDTLKTAARELSDTILGASAASGTPDRVYIGLVPFADTVNVGNTANTRQWLDYPPAQTYFMEHYWKGCIVEPRTDKWGGTNLPAKIWTPLADFQPLHLTIRTPVDRAALNLAENNPSGVYERIAPATALEAQPRSFDANGDTYDRRVWARRSSSTSFDVYSAANPSNCDESRATHFLNNDLDSIHAAIDDMHAKGNTLIPTGLLWAWRMLHPSWRGTPGWGNPDMPRDPDPKILSKVIVLLTDGQNQPPDKFGVDQKSERDFAYGMTYDVQSCTDSAQTNCSTALTARTYLQPVFNAAKDQQAPMNSLKMRDPFSTDTDNTLNPSIGWGSNTSISTTTVDNYLKNLCEIVKNDGNGIKIYTVTLGTVGSATETLMNDCSTGAGYFYNATTVSDLPEVFKSIAGALTELRLTL